MATSASPTIHIAVDTSQAMKGINQIKTALTELQDIYKRVTADSAMAAKAGGAVHKALTKEAKNSAAATKQTGNAVRSTTSAMRDQTKAMYDLRGAARGLSGSLGMLWTTYGSLAPLLAGAAIAGASRSAFTIGKDLEYRLAMVEAISGQAATVADLMPAVLGSMKTPLEAAEAMQALAQAGMQVQDALTALPAVTALATVGEIEMSDAAVTLTASLNAFNLEATDAARVADVFAKTASISTTTVAQITGAMKQASTNAGQFKISVEETSAALAVMAERNITGSLAGTAFRNMTKELYTPIARGAKALEQMGVSAYDSEGKMRGFIPILKDLQANLVILDEQSRDAMLEAIFGERGSRAIKPILADFDAYLQKVDELGDATGFLAQANAKLLNTVEGAMNRLRSSMEQVKAEAFDNVRRQILETIKELDQYAKSEQFSSMLETIISLVSQVTLTLARNADTLIALGKTYAGLKVGIGGVNLILSTFAKGISAGSSALNALKVQASDANTQITLLGGSLGILRGISAGLAVFSSVLGLGFTLYTGYTLLRDFLQVKKDIDEKLASSELNEKLKTYGDTLKDQADQMEKTTEKMLDPEGRLKTFDLIAQAEKERASHTIRLIELEKQLIEAKKDYAEASDNLRITDEKWLSRREVEERTLSEMLTEYNDKKLESLKYEGEISNITELRTKFARNRQFYLDYEARVQAQLTNQQKTRKELGQTITELTAEQLKLENEKATSLSEQARIEGEILRIKEAQARQAIVGKPASEYRQEYSELERMVRGYKQAMDAFADATTAEGKAQFKKSKELYEVGSAVLTKAWDPDAYAATRSHVYSTGSSVTFLDVIHDDLKKGVDKVKSLLLKMTLDTGKGGGRRSFDDPNTILKRMTVSTITDQMKHQASVAKVAEAHLRDVRDAQLELDKQYMSEGALYALAARNKAGDRYNALLDKAKENIEKLQEAMKAATDETVIANAQAALDLEYKRVEALEEQKKLAEERAEIEGRKRYDEDNTFFNKLRKHYSDAANDAENFSDVMKNAGVSAFQTMGDALEDLVVKGKLDFRSLAISILEDMSRMMFRWMMMQALGMFADGGFTGFGKPAPVAQAFPVDMRRWTGGYTGDGGKFQPMGVVHGGEYVLNKEATSQLGLPMLDYMNRTGKLPTQGYATGGFVGNNTSWYPESAGRGNINVNVTVNITDQGADVSADGAERFGEDVAKMVEALIIKHEIRTNQPGGTAWRQRRGR